MEPYSSDSPSATTVDRNHFVGDISNTPAFHNAEHREIQAWICSHNNTDHHYHAARCMDTAPNDEAHYTKNRKNKNTMNNILKLIRPYQWIKNVFVFMPIFFSGALTDTSALMCTFLAFMAYSFAASSIYCYNDIIDVEDDRRHSEKCKRPIASGAISVGVGYTIMGIMVMLSAATIALLRRSEER